MASKLGSKADPETQEICLDGEPVRTESSAHYLLYKPRGYICSLKADGEAGIEDLCLSRDGSRIAVAMDREEVRFVDVVTKSWAKVIIE